MATAISVSDGSFFLEAKVGSCAWILSSPDGREWIEGGGIIPGEDTDQGSYRSELGGQCGIAVAVDCLVLPDPLTGEPYHITTICDGLAALNKVGICKEYIKTSGKHVDLISIITSLWTSSSFTPTTEHIYAHQDENNVSPLSMKANLNCKMDSIAKVIAQLQIANRRNISFMKSGLGLGTVMLGKTIIASRMQSSLYTSIMPKKLVAWLANKYNFTPSSFQSNIEWYTLNKARRESSLPLKIFMTKWISEDIASGVVMVRRKQRMHSNCPMCNLPGENTTHILQCQHSTICTLRIDLLSELKVWLASKDTDPDIINFIHKGLTAWFNSDSADIGHNLDMELLTAFRSQLLIGWEATLHGFLSHKLVSCQKSYYTQIGSRKLGTRWGIQLITKLWNIIYHHWIHRNNLLHKSNAYDILSGREHLEEAVFVEYSAGLDNLPYIYAPYFLTTLEDLFAKDAKHIKQWFLVIRSGREASGTVIYTDKCSTDPSFRNWIGLNPLP